MRHIRRRLIPAVMLMLLAACSGFSGSDDPAPGSLAAARAEIRQAVQSIAEDIAEQDIEALQAAHLNSGGFSKFGPRSFERQDLSETNESEARFFSSITDVEYEVRDLKVDVFGSAAVATYYPHASFTMDGERRSIDGRQTFVFVRTGDGWKLAHEHGTLRR